MPRNNRISAEGLAWRAWGDLDHVLARAEKALGGADRRAVSFAGTDIPWSGDVLSYKHLAGALAAQAARIGALVDAHEARMAEEEAAYYGPLNAALAEVPGEVDRELRLFGRIGVLDGNGNRASDRLAQKHKLPARDREIVEAAVVNYLEREWATVLEYDGEVYAVPTGLGFLPEFAENLGITALSQISCNARPEYRAAIIEHLAKQRAKRDGWAAGDEYRKRARNPINGFERGQAQRAANEYKRKEAENAA